MREHNHAGAGVAVVALATGSLIGLAVGLLYSPKSGEENRRNLKNKYNETRSRIRYKAGRFKESIKDKAGNRHDDADDGENESSSRLLVEGTELDGTRER